MSELEPEILFEDVHLIVLSKPAGLLSQGEHTGDLNVVDWLRQRLGRPYVGLVHRLDRNTSGIMVVAKRSKSANRLTEQLQDGRLHRTYLAWAHGRLEAPRRWEHVLLKDTKTNRVRVISKNSPGSSPGKLSALRAEPLAYGSWNGAPLTLIQFTLETGRSHQIRVQSAQEGYPLLGDTKYGAAKTSKDGFGRPALHSHRLRFEHPMSGECLEFEAPLPADMAGIPTTERKPQPLR